MTTSTRRFDRETVRFALSCPDPERALQALKRVVEAVERGELYSYVTVEGRIELYDYDRRKAERLLARLKQLVPVFEQLLARPPIDLPPELSDL